jgi:hypothetical protein
MLEIENQDIPAPPTQHGWLITHPYTSVLIVACAFFITGAVIVIQHSAATTPAPQTAAWGGDIGTLADPTASAPAAGTGPTGGDIMSQVQGSPPYSYTIPPLNIEEKPQSPAAQDDSFDYRKLLADSRQNSGSATPTTTAGITDISYAFPPTGLFSTQTPPAARTSTQDALYNYGNEVGSFIQTYEQAHPDQSKVLKDQLEDPQNPNKVQAVIRMAHDLEDIGKSMSSIERVPPQVASAHAAVAKSYQEMGQNLARMPLAQGSEALLQGIKVYNASADAFTKNFVSLATTFSTYGVTFGADEAGSAFTFTSSN